MGFVQGIKNEEPGIYWVLVDMAASGKSARYIAGHARWMIESANEARAKAGRPKMRVEIPAIA